MGALCVCVLQYIHLNACVFIKYTDPIKTRPSIPPSLFLSQMQLAVIDIFQFN
jgi:hypothetical protein